MNTALDPLLLPGQAAAPAGPVDMTMMYVVHHALRRDLRRFAAAVSETPSDDAVRWAALADRWELFARILEAHHTAEDEGLWPALRHRAEPQERIVLDDMYAEHARIDPCLETVRTGFAAITATGADEHARAALIDGTESARDLLDAHLGHEETDALPILQRRLAPHEWAVIDERHFRQEMTPEETALLLCWFADGLPPSAHDRLFGLLGAPAEQLWRVSVEGYLGAERVAFGAP